MSPCECLSGIVTRHFLAALDLLPLALRAPLPRARRFRLRRRDVCAEPFDPFVEPGSSLNQSGAPEFDRVYLVARLLSMLRAERAQAVADG